MKTTYILESKDRFSFRTTYTVPDNSIEIYSIVEDAVEDCLTNNRVTCVVKHSTIMVYVNEIPVGNINILLRPSHMAIPVLEFEAKPEREVNRLKKEVIAYFYANADSDNITLVTNMLKTVYQERK